MPSLAIEINYTILTVNFCLGPFLFGPNLSILDLSLAPKLYHMATTLAKYQPQTLPKVGPILGPSAVLVPVACNTHCQVRQLQTLPVLGGLVPPVLFSTCVLFPTLYPWQGRYPSG